MTTSYEQGRAAEYRCQELLETEGYTTCRAAGSKGKIDVIAWNTSEIRFIQVKTYRSKAGSYKQDVAALDTLALPANGAVELWVRRVGSRTWDVRYIRTNTTFTPDTRVDD